MNVRDTKLQKQFLAKTVSHDERGSGLLLILFHNWSGRVIVLTHYSQIV